MKSFITLKSMLVILIFMLLVYLVVALSKKPSNDLKWAEDFAVLPTIEKNTLEPNIFQVNNMRNWEFTKNGPISKNYINREFSIDEVSDVWFVLQPFGAYDLVAHAFLIFDFEDSCPIAISVEARKEEGETYGVVKGLLNQFEISYLWLTEQDVYTNRILFNNDPVYMYPLKIDQESAQKLLISFINSTNDLQSNPKFYNTFTDNCTNTLAQISNKSNIDYNVSPFAIGNYVTGLSLNYLASANLLDIDGDLTEKVRKDHYINDLFAENYSKFEMNDSGCNTELTQLIRTYLRGEGAFETSVN